jgi:hypothetical protein
VFANTGIEQRHHGTEDFPDVGQFVHVPAILLAQVLEVIDDLLNAFGVLANVAHTTCNDLPCPFEAQAGKHEAALLLLVLVEDRQGILPDPRQQRGIRQDGVIRVVDLVRDAGRQYSERGQARAADGLPLQLAVLGDVGDHHHRSHHRASPN